MGPGLKVSSADFNSFGGDYPGVGGGDTFGVSPTYNLTYNYNYSARNASKAAPSWAASALAGFNAGYGAISARNQAQGQKNALGFEAQFDANSAAIAGYQAQLALQAGAAKEQNARLQTAAQFGADRARMAASGIDLGQGSATDVLASTEYLGERQAMSISNAANRQAWQDRMQQYQDQAHQQEALAKMNAINPDMSAFGSLLGGASSFAMKQWGNG